MKEFVALLVSGFYKTLPLKDFHGGNLVYLESVAQVHLSAAKLFVDSPEQRPALWQESDGGGDHLHLFH